MKLYGYIRVSTDDQTTENQRKMIKDAGFAVEEFFSEEGVSGSLPAMERPAFTALQNKLVSGDTVVCTMVDRLGRSASDVLKTVENFKSKGIKLKVMQFDGIDLTSSMGKMVLTMLAACAEFERNILIERINAGMARAKSEGVYVGKSLKYSPDIVEGIIIDRSKGMLLKDISIKWSVALSSCDRLIKKWENKIEEYKREWNEREIQYSR